MTLPSSSSLIDPFHSYHSNQNKVETQKNILQLTQNIITPSNILVPIRLSKQLVILPSTHHPTRMDTDGNNSKINSVSLI